MAIKCGMRIVISVFIATVKCVKGAELDVTTQSIDISWIVTVVGLASLLVLVVVLSLCGGCTPMEVGSDDHAASGGRKSEVQYSGVCTDANTRVLTSGTSLPNDPYSPGSQALPYPLHPQTENNFTGYQSQPQYQNQTSYQGQGQTGYGAQGQSGYIGQGQSQHGYQATPAGAHRQFAEEEPPPPAYSEAVQASAPQQQNQGPYGW